MAQNTISDELNRLIHAKADIKSALEEKGVVIGESSTLDEYPALILEMQTGGGGYDTSTIIDLIEGDITSFEIPEGTTKIGKNCFSSRTSLTNINIPNSVTEIWEYAFNNTALTTVNIPNSVTTIKGYAFAGANSIKSLTIPNSVTKLELYTFLSMNNLEYLKLSESLSTLPSYSIYSCPKLKKLVIPDNVSTLETAFCYQLNLDSMIIGSGIKNIKGQINNMGEIHEVVLLAQDPPQIVKNFWKAPKMPITIFVKNLSVDLYKTTWDDVSILPKIKPLAAINYDASTYTVTASGRDNVELYVDASLCDTSVYTFTPGTEDSSHVITVTSTDPSLGLLDTSTLEVLVPADVTNKDYMCLTCVDENGGTIGGWDPYVETQDSSVSDIYYSSDKRNWTLWNKTYSNDSHSYTYDTINMNENDALYFKATGLGNPLSKSDYFNFTMSGEMEGSGNAMSLLYGDNFENQTEMPASGLYRTFNNCSTLTTAPDLPATVLNTICYYRTFDGCRNLSYINALFIDTYDTSIQGVVLSATYNWVKNVSTNGTFVKNPDAIWDVSGVNGVPEGWTIEGWTPPAPAGQTFVKVTSADLLADGKKCIIVYDDVALGSWKETETGNHDGDFSGVSVTAGNEIDISNTETSDPETPGWVLSIDVLTLKSISNNQYNLQYDNGNYIFSNRQGTSLTTSSTPFAWNITNLDKFDINFNYFAIQHSITDSVYINSTGEAEDYSFNMTTGNPAMLYVEKTT